MSHSVQEAYNYCYTIMKNYSKSFSFAFNQLPLEKKASRLGYLCILPTSG
ncbi:hypothetical protein [Listeria fleischmannii]|nr:hypothetical protein [Listeria fleischmannii]EMG28871.1 hypothetical protein LFLEISCH_03005 [Listeria fleischmannii subsp. fleischmannii LU2006-1]